EALCAGLGFPPGRFTQYDRACWNEMAGVFAEAFATRTRDDWATHFESLEACVTPVLSIAEAPFHPHNRARDLFDMPDGVPRRAPAPRFWGSPAMAVPPETRSLDDIMARWS